MTDSDPKPILEELMRKHSFTDQTRLYRTTLPEFLAATDAPEVFNLSANEQPSEAVIDIYSGGHICIAEQVGAGLAFVESAENEWRADDRTTVSVLLRDVLNQGGRIYPVESVITDRTWYLTLPAGSVAVRKEQPEAN